MLQLLERFFVKWDGSASNGTATCVIFTALTVLFEGIILTD